MDLFEHQKRVIESAPKRLALCFGMGTGKTLTAIKLAEKYRASVLVVCPKGLVKQWEEGLTLYPYKWKVLSKENFKKYKEEIGYWDCFIGDESHLICGYKSQIHKAVYSYLKKNKIPYRYFLTATPITATPYSAYALARLMGFEPNYWDFTRKFFIQKRLGNRVIMIPDPKQEQVLIDYIKKFGVFVKIEDVIDVPTQTFEVEYFELNDDQKNKIKEIKETESEPIAKWTKINTVENGIFIGDKYNKSETFSCQKNDRIIELVKQNKKIAVFARYNAQLYNLKSLLEPYKRSIFVINGENKDRYQTIKDIEKSNNAIVLINSSCSAGYELPSINMIIFASLSFSYIDFMQSCGRFLRANKPTPNHYITLTIKGGVDNEVYNCIVDKKDFYIRLFNDNNYGII